MSNIFTLEQIARFSDPEIDRFINDYLSREAFHYSPGKHVMVRIMDFESAYSNPMGTEDYPGIINN